MNKLTVTFISTTTHSLLRLGPTVSTLKFLVDTDTRNNRVAVLPTGRFSEKPDSVLVLSWRAGCRGLATFCPRPLESPRHRLRVDRPSTARRSNRGGVVRQWADADGSGRRLALGEIQTGNGRSCRGSFWIFRRHHGVCTPPQKRCHYTTVPSAWVLISSRCLWGYSTKIYRLRIYGTFSTNRLHRSFEKYVAVKKVKLMRKLTTLRVGNKRWKVKHLYGATSGNRMQLQRRCCVTDRAGVQPVGITYDTTEGQDWNKRNKIDVNCRRGNLSCKNSLNTAELSGYKR